MVHWIIFYSPSITNYKSIPITLTNVVNILNPEAGASRVICLHVCLCVRMHVCMCVLVFAVPHLIYGLASEFLIRHQSLVDTKLIKLSQSLTHSFRQGAEWQGWSDDSDGQLSLTESLLTQLITLSFPVACCTDAVIISQYPPVWTEPCVYAQKVFPDILAGCHEMKWNLVSPHIFWCWYCVLLDSKSMLIG